MAIAYVVHVCIIVYVIICIEPILNQQSSTVPLQPPAVLEETDWADENAEGNELQLEHDEVVVQCYFNTCT